MTQLDPFHSDVVEGVCASDAARVAAGEREFVRFGVDHEFCLPNTCVVWPTVVAVFAVAPGIRVRRPICPAYFDGAAA